MTSWTFTASDEQQTALLGRALAEVLPDGAVVALVGTLGSGKTRLVQALAVACGVPAGTAVSPTFVLCQEYYGRRTIYHMDAYRIADVDEFLQLGVEEYFDADGITLVEWADRVERCLPPERLEVQIEVTGPQSRRIIVQAVGATYAAIVQNLARRIESGSLEV